MPHCGFESTRLERLEGELAVMKSNTVGYVPFSPVCYSPCGRVTCSLVVQVGSSLERDAGSFRGRRRVAFVKALGGERRSLSVLLGNMKGGVIREGTERMMARFGFQKIRRDGTGGGK